MNAIRKVAAATLALTFTLTGAALITAPVRLAAAARVASYGRSRSAHHPQTAAPAPTQGYGTVRDRSQAELSE